MSKVQVDTIDTRSGTSTMQIGSTNTSTINIGVSGDTVNIPSGVTIANAGTATGFGGDNTPSFYATSSSATSLVSGNYTKVVFNTEVYDTDSAYDPSTNYRFTVPSGEGGKYWISSSWGADSGNDTDKISVFVRVNGNNKLGMVAVNKAYNTTNVSGVVVLAAGDYVETFAYQDSGTTYNVNTDATVTFFCGYKLIGV